MNQGTIAHGGGGSQPTNGQAATAEGSGPLRSTKTIPVVSIRPEEGLARKRGREGHQELRDSIAKFGVLTPITVRPADDGSGEYLLVKGQGRTLACRMLGITHVDAVILDPASGENEKVQQFLVENVARLRMRPVDRALLVTHARSKGEETASVASRFGITASTVRRLESQLDGATSTEIAALRTGQLSLAAHAIVARFVAPDDRAEVIDLVNETGVTAPELQSLLVGIGWSALEDLGSAHRDSRLALLDWACRTIRTFPCGSLNSRLRQVAAVLPTALPATPASVAL